MAAPRREEPRMNADAFMAWYEQQPDGRRYELLDGRVYEMQGERAQHARIKKRVVAAFDRVIVARNIPCETFMDGMAVRIDHETVFEPDAFVQCGAPVDDTAIIVPDPVIVVEVASPSTQRIDATMKLTHYFRNSRIAHYLVIIPMTRQIIQHRRDSDAVIETTIHRSGSISLDPPGIAFSLDEVFGTDSVE